MNLEEHIKNNCKFTIKKYEGGEIYIGEKVNNLREGYDIYFDMKSKNMKVNGKMIKEMVMEYIIFLMGIYMKVNLKKVNLKDGKMINLKDMEYYIILVEINMKVNGKMINMKDMEYYIFLVEIDMKVNLKMINMKDMEYYIFLVEINMKV